MLSRYLVIGHRFFALAGINNTSPTMIQSCDGTTLLVVEDSLT
jgi:hypothetical protein